jgi:hypothetical protein
MIRTQIYLTEDERTAIQALAAAAGKPQSEIIREAVDEMIARSGAAHRDAVLDATAGLWRDRDDLPDFRALRQEWDRGAAT